MNRLQIITLNTLANMHMYECMYTKVYIHMYMCAHTQKQNTYIYVHKYKKKEFFSP